MTIVDPQLADLVLAYGNAVIAQHSRPTDAGQTALGEAVLAIYAHVDKIERQRDELRAKLANATVQAVVALVEQVGHEYRRAEAAHDAKDEANRRWLDATVATRCPDVHDDGVTRCHDNAGHDGDEHGGVGPHGSKTWTRTPQPAAS